MTKAEQHIWNARRAGVKTMFEHMQTILTGLKAYQDLSLLSEGELGSVTAIQIAVDMDVGRFDETTDKLKVEVFDEQA
jgi:hypothetical protein